MSRQQQRGSAGAAVSQRALLTTLRYQSNLIGSGRCTPERAPELYELAQRAAARSGQRYVRYGGINFPLMYGTFLVSVVDPETGKFLVGTNGG